MQIIVCTRRHLLHRGNNAAQPKLTTGAADRRALVQKAVRVMKLTAFFILATYLHVNATDGFGQKVTLSEREVHVEKIFNEIKKQTGFNFLYTSNILANTHRVTVNVTNTLVTEVLDMVVAGQGLEYRVKGEDKLIIIKTKPPVKTVVDTDVKGGPIDVSGLVTDNEGRPLPGANVKVRGSNVGVVTDKDGRFSLRDIPENSVLEISYVGHDMKTFTVRGSGMVNIALEQKLSLMDETVVIGYGTTTNRLKTGNVAIVKAEDIARQPVNNPLLALQGRVAGLVITPANGIAGGGITIRIQGRNNLDNTLFGSKSDPLIIVDGVPYPSQNLKTFKGGGGFPILGTSSNDGTGSSVDFGSPIAFLNPSDIESISVLKDADATAIYGSRAANGVILIMTKKGKAERIKTDINIQQGWGKVAKKMDLLNSQQYMEMRREAKKNENRSVSISDYDLRGLWDTTQNTDWQKELIGGTAVFTRINAGVSGGSNNVQYLLSGTYGRETTVFPGSFANILGSIHFNIAASSANQRLKVQLGGSYMANCNKLPTEDFTNYALNLPPVAPSLFNDDGSLNWAPDSLQNGNSSWFNPLARNSTLFEIKTHNLISNGSLSYRILPALEFKSNFGFTSNMSDQIIAALDGSEKPENRVGRLRSSTFSFNTIRSWILEPQLNFQKKLNQHLFSILVGTTFQSQMAEGRVVVVRGQASDLLLKDMGAGSLANGGSDMSEYKYNAIFTRLGYNFKNKYLINFTGRRDGSSRFGANSHFHNFGAIGVGWILSDEMFLKDLLRIVSFAKIRASYGITGNDQIGNYRFMSLFSSNSGLGIPYQGQAGLSPNNLPNPNLEWEETQKLSIGVDLGFIKDRVNFAANFNRNRSSNSLTQIQMPQITGFRTIIDNIDALIENTSWEITLNTINFNKSVFRWSTNINFTIPRNKLLAFPNKETSILNQYMQIGQPLNTIKTYQFYGVNPLTGNNLVFSKQGDAVSSPSIDDQIIFVNTDPKWYGGLQNNLTYKSFSIDFFIQFKKQYANDVLILGPPGYFYVDEFSVINGNQPSGVMHRWQKPGDISNYQRFSSTGSNASITSGNLAYRDCSFARLKNVAISYQFSSPVLKTIGMQQLSVYANAQNLLTITRYHGLDPETLSVNALPPLRMITIGLKVVL